MSPTGINRKARQGHSPLCAPCIFRAATDHEPFTWPSRELLCRGDTRLPPTPRRPRLNTAQKEGSSPSKEATPPAWQNAKGPNPSTN
eukprot:8842803-Alexandrium_andersonii.AAC.1